MNMPDINNLNRAEPERETTPQQKEANAQIDRAINALKAEHALRRATGELAEIARLRAEKAELLAALVKITDIIGAASGRKLPICLQIDEIARAAFERVKEGK